MSFRRILRACGWCTRQGFRLSLWTTWLALLVALAGQAYLLSARRVPVPEPLRRLVARRLADEGLRVDFDRARMNLTGRFVFENVRLGPTSSPDPLASARTLYLDFNPWELLVGRLGLREARLGGLDLHDPASPAAPTPAPFPANNIDLGLIFDGAEIELSYFTGYIGPVAVQASGRFRPPASAAEKSSPSAEQAFARYAELIAAFRKIAPSLAALDEPRVRLAFSPGVVDLDLRATQLDLDAAPIAFSGKITGLRVNASVPLDTATDKPIEVIAAFDRARLPGETTVDDVRLRLQGTLGALARFEPRALDVNLASLRWREITGGPVAAVVTQPAPGLVRADTSVALAGSAWSLRVETAPRAATARVILDGFVGDDTLAFAGRQIDRDLSSLLDPDSAAPLHVAASFGPEWKLAEVSGRLHSGRVRVGGAILDETGTEFTYDGAHVLCDALVLRQGESLAHGSYEMDTRSMDFRFLLTGGLRPAGIESWFHDWWSNFWSMFDFSGGLPYADVDVRGRWGDLTATQVFVQAEGAATGLKGVDFDRVRTRLFLRPHWFDILHFDVLRQERAAAGWLARSLDLEKDTWRFMEFDVESTLPLATIATLFKEESAELLAPYRFDTPPRLRISGRVDSPDSPLGKKEHIDVALTSTGPMTYHDFPLSDLAFEARLRDDRIDLPVLALGFAEGKANGTAGLWGPENARQLAFDITLADANLGAVTQAVARLQPSPATSASAAEPPAKTSEAARERQQRLDRGRLVFSLAAEGPYSDFYSFKGSGRAAITGAELAQLNLFGPLSQALSGTHFSFGSFSLTTVDAPFVLECDRVRFDNLRVTGPSALIQAKGDYRLRDSRLDFSTKIHPFDESASVVGNAVGFVLSPLSKMFEVKLQGTLAEPKWIFAYGPSRLFNSITGSGDSPPSPHLSAPPAEPPPAATAAPSPSP